MPLSSVVGAQSIVKPGVCTSSTRPASPYDGQVIYETDTDKTLVWNGSGWVMLATGTANAPGLELVATGSGTAASSMPVTSKFSSTYDNYRLIVDITASSANVNCWLRLRSGTTNASGSDYYGYSTSVSSDGTTSGIASSGTAQFAFMGIYTTTHNSAVFDILSPFLSIRTNINHQAYG